MDSKENFWEPLIYKNHVNILHLINPSNVVSSFPTRSEYVNQDVQDFRPERPSTLPRKSRADRRLPNGLTSGHSVENAGYLVPANSTSPAFDNPYYLDLLAKAKAVAGATSSEAASQRDSRVTKPLNGFVTPTAENPEYLGLVDSWSGLG